MQSIEILLVNKKIDNQKVLKLGVIIFQTNLKWLITVGKLNDNKLQTFYFIYIYTFNISNTKCTNPSSIQQISDSTSDPSSFRGEKRTFDEALETFGIKFVK